MFVLSKEFDKLTEADKAELVKIVSAVPSLHMRGGVADYLAFGIPGGSFLNAILCNDFVGAFSRADEHNMYLMKSWAQWLYMACPSVAWHTEERVKDWIAKGGMYGRSQTNVAT